MNLETALLDIHTRYHLAGDLYFVSQLDKVGGYHPDAAQAKWPVGSVFEVEGRVLYAIILAYQPINCVEIGLQDGCSATHIASALRDNELGHLTSVDRGNSGRLIPDWAREYISVVGGDGAEWLEAQPDGSIDFLFEDADHSEDLSYRIGVLAQNKLAPGGLFVAHDATHFIVGANIQLGYTRAGMDYTLYSIEPSDCGLLIWQQTGEWAIPEAAAKKPSARKKAAKK